MNMEFKDNLLQYRKEKGLSQEDLAIRCNVSRQAVSKWENGTANPDMENLKALSECLQISIDKLLGNEAYHQDEKIIREIVYMPSGWNHEYTSRITLLGLPFVSINCGRGKDHNGKRRVAKGWIAVGNTAIGVISIGFLSAGILSFGFLSLGILFSFGLLALGMYALGTLAIGYTVFGVMAIGVYAVGALAIGFQMGIGAFAYGQEAVGVKAAGDIVFLVKNNDTCFLDTGVYEQIQTILETRSLPYLIRIILSMIPLC